MDRSMPNSLNPWTEVCIECGKTLNRVVRPQSAFCGNTCKNVAWRAVKMLEGSYHWANHQFVRRQKESPANEPGE